jgi:hypothetical protein
MAAIWDRRSPAVARKVDEPVESSAREVLDAIRHA